MGLKRRGAYGFRLHVADHLPDLPDLTPLDGDAVDVALDWRHASGLVDRTQIDSDLVCLRERGFSLLEVKRDPPSIDLEFPEPANDRGPRPPPADDADIDPGPLAGETSPSTPAASSPRTVPGRSSGRGKRGRARRWPASPREACRCSPTTCSSSTGTSSAPAPPASTCAPTSPSGCRRRASSARSASGRATG